MPQWRRPLFRFLFHNASSAIEFFKIPVSVTNNGDTTAETVQIEVKLENAGVEKESAQFEIGFLPRHSQREGWVTFETDPRTVEEMSAKVLGFEQP